MCRRHPKQHGRDSRHPWYYSIRSGLHFCSHHGNITQLSGESLPAKVPVPLSTLIITCTCKHMNILYISRSILLWAYVLPQVRQDPLEETHKQKLESVRQYMTRKSIPSDLHARVIRYYEFQHSRNRQNAMSAGCEPDPPKACAPVLQRAYPLYK